MAVAAARLEVPVVKGKTMTVTPEMAANWLEKNTHNRPIKQARVDEYAVAMKKGRWKLNGESIIFDWDDVLQDGQHRLWACVESKKSFETVVVFGVDPASFSTIDTGVKRSAADVVNIAGHKTNHGTISAAATLVHHYKQGTVMSRGRVAPALVLDIVEKNSDLTEWVGKCKRAKSWANRFASMVSATLYLGSRKHPKEAEEFLHLFQTGENLTTGSPILALRNRLITDDRMKKDERWAIIVFAWNAFVAKRNMTKIQVPRSDKFPKISGAPT